MSWNDFGFGDEKLFDFDGNGRLDLFETALEISEQDRELEEMRRGPDFPDLGDDADDPLDDGTKSNDDSDF